MGQTMKIWQVTINSTVKFWVDPDHYPKHMIEKFAEDDWKIQQAFDKPLAEEIDMTLKPAIVVEEHNADEVYGNAVSLKDGIFKRSILSIPS